LEEIAMKDRRITNPQADDDRSRSPTEDIPAVDAIDSERKQLADKLRETREFLGLSQQEVADAVGPTVGLTRLAVSAIETGRRKLESVELAALARVYGQPVSYFLPAGEKDQPEPEEVKFIARAASTMTPEDRAELLRFAEFLKSYKAPGQGEVATTPGPGARGKR